MSSLALLQSLKESVLSQASVKAIYGEPITAQGRTVIPVAKIMYGLRRRSWHGRCGRQQRPRRRRWWRRRSASHSCRGRRGQRPGNSFRPD